MIARYKPKVPFPNAPLEIKQRVFDVGSPNILGTIVRVGEEVSEVKWDDGNTRFVSNNYLKGEQT